MHTDKILLQMHCQTLTAVGWCVHVSWFGLATVALGSYPHVLVTISSVGLFC